MNGFERLIHPLSAEAFFDRHFDGTPLFCQRDAPDGFADFLSLADLDTVLSLAGQPGTMVRFLVDHHCHNAAQASLSEIRQAYLAGRTVVLNNLARVWPPIARLCRQLEEVFGGVVRGNLYLTPPQSRALSPHWDAYPVFAIQLHGEKTWRVGAPQFDRPLPSQTYTPPVVLPDDAAEYTLRAGDSLFVPRGYTHDVFTGEAPSLHISFGLHPRLWVDAVRQAVDLAAERLPELRRLLLDREGFRPDNAALSALLREIADLALAEPATEAVRAAAIEKRSEAADHHLMDLVLGRTVEADTPLQRRAGMQATYSEEGERVFLRCLLGKIPLPARVLPDLAFIDQGRTFRPRDLPSLDEEGAVRLCRKLLDLGLLGFADSNPRHDNVP